MTTQQPNFFDVITERARKLNSLLCVGIDPHYEDLLVLQKPEEAILDTTLRFCFRIIDQTNKYAVCYKPNYAFFAALGYEGLRVLQTVIQYCGSVPVILDQKMGDISSTGAAYAHSSFEVLKASCATVNPYMGGDAIKPFLQIPFKGVFVLCKTSNPTADEVQNQCLASGDPLYLHIAKQSLHWGDASRIGLVLGATDISALKTVRQALPHHWFLTPGIGHQHGDLKAVLEHGLRKLDGLGVLISVSRGISRSTKTPGEAAKDLVDDVRRIKQFFDF